MIKKLYNGANMQGQPWKYVLTRAKDSFIVSVCCILSKILGREVGTYEYD